MPSSRICGRLGRRSAWIGLAATAVLASGAAAQVPATPVLQNAFMNRGLAIAGNFGSTSGQSFYGLAAGWGMGRLQVSGAAGALRGNDATRGAYGVRAAANLWTSRAGSLGAGAFAGVGGAPSTRSGNVLTNAAVMHVPAGVSVGYQRYFGRRGVSAYVAPLYRWSRYDDDATITTSGTIRVAFGVDVSVTPSIGASLGAELGRSNATRGSGSGSFGAAVTFVPGGR